MVYLSGVSGESVFGHEFLRIEGCRILDAREFQALYFKCKNKFKTYLNIAF